MESNLRIPLTYILAHTKPGDVVVDLFGGTLSTAQACLRTDRRIYVLKKIFLLFVLSIPKKFLLQLFSYLQTCEFDVQCFDYAMQRLKLDLARVVW